MDDSTKIDSAQLSPSDSGLNANEIQRIQFWIDNAGLEMMDSKPDWVEDVEFCLRILTRGKLDDLPKWRGGIESEYGNSDHEATRLDGIEPSSPRRDPISAPSLFRTESVSSPESTRQWVSERYQNPKLVGVGGFGVVFRVDDSKLGIPVAIKILRPSKGASREVRSRFLDEAKTTASLSHRNIIRVYDTGILASPTSADSDGDFRLPGAEGLPYLTSQYVDGPSLRKKMESTKHLSPRKSAWLVHQIADAVRLAHSKTTLHRDIKPANVLLEPMQEDESEKLGFRPILTDFGLAKQLDRSQEESYWTEEGALLGTTRYMSPEQARGDHAAIGTASDVFSLGTILYELLTGRNPFVGNNSLELRNSIQQSTPPRPRSIHSSIPSDLEAITLKALAIDPEERYAGAYELWADLGRFLAYEPVEAERYSWIRKVSYTLRKHPVVTSLAFLTLIINFVAIFGLAYSLQKEQKALAIEQQSLKREQESKRVEKELRQQESDARQREQVAMKEVVSLYTDIMDKLIAGRRVHARELVHSLESTTKVMEECTKSNVGSEKLLHGLSVLLHYLAIVKQNSENAEISNEYREKVVLILDKLLEKSPENETYRYQRFFSRRLIGEFLAAFPSRRSSRDGLDGITTLRQSLDEIRTLSHEHPENIDYSDALACTYLTVSNALKTDDPTYSDSLLHQGIDISLANWKRNPERSGLVKYAVKGSLIKAQRHLLDKNIDQAYLEARIANEMAEQAWGDLKEEIWAADEFTRVLDIWCPVLIETDRWQEAKESAELYRRCTEMLEVSNPNESLFVFMRVKSMIWQSRAAEQLNELEERDVFDQELLKYIAPFAKNEKLAGGIRDQFDYYCSSIQRNRYLEKWGK